MTPASQALNQSRIDWQRSRSGESVRQADGKVKQLWWMAFRFETEWDVGEEKESK